MNSQIAKKDMRWAWVQIDLNAYKKNVSALRKCLRPGCKYMSVVKADAYGHGAVEIAKAALLAGADYLGVASVSEGVELRQANISAPVLVLAEPPIEAIPLLIEFNIMPSIYTTEFAIQYGEAADVLGKMAPYHLAINTGMNRIGVDSNRVIEFLKMINFHRALQLEGTFTHFATAESDDTLDFQRQCKRFIEAIDAMRTAGVNPRIVHAAASAAALRYPDVQFDMVRFGAIQYGYYVCSDLQNIVEVNPVMTVHARITDVRSVPIGEGVSYGLHYKSIGTEKICTVPIGYGDGLRRDLSGRIEFVFDGTRCRQVGTICMDACMFAVDMRSYGIRRRLDPQIGDDVVIIGDGQDGSLTISDVAAMLGTIPHEVGILFSHRMPRVFV